MEVRIPALPVVEEDRPNRTMEATSKECKVGPWVSGERRRDQLWVHISTIETDLGQAHVFLRVESLG